MSSKNKPYRRLHIPKCHLIENALNFTGEEDSGKKKGSQLIQHKYIWNSEENSTFLKSN